jgi:hypothetical protein
MSSTLIRKPSLALPEPLRAAEIPSFTHYSVVVRLPEIARRTLADNHFSPEVAQRIETLIREVTQGGKVRPVIGVPAVYGWEAYARPYLGMNWLQIPWFFAEEYFYLRLLEACAYFVEGPDHLVDPYAEQKRLGLESTRAGAALLAKQVQHALSLPPDQWRDSLTRLLLADLWGNQNDLSMWPVEQSGEGNKMSGGSAQPGHGSAGQPELSAARAHALADDTTLLLDYLAGLDPAKMRPRHLRVDIILDNAGYELVADLALVDFLLSAGLADQVMLHTKCYPVFVSDALDKDIHATLDWLCFLGDPAACDMAIRLRRCLVSGALRMGPHPFWTSPLPAWEMPADLLEEIGKAHLVLSKGDANYRRLLGDLHWPLETPFAAVVSYFQPALLALRTCKSEIGVGIAPERIPQNEEKWLYNGRWGLIEFAPPGR